MKLSIRLYNNTLFIFAYNKIELFDTMTVINSLTALSCFTAKLMMTSLWQDIYFKRMLKPNYLH